MCVCLSLLEKKDSARFGNNRFGEEGEEEEEAAAKAQRYCESKVE